MFTILMCFVYGILVGLNFAAWWWGDCWAYGLRLVGLLFIGEVGLVSMGAKE